VDERSLEEHAERLKQSHRTEGELIFAIFEDETKLGRPHTPGERDAFTRGFFSTEYGDEIRLLMALGVTDPEDGPEGAE
jgi:hypothetical protein